jgi:hypothetical protein
MPNTEVIQEWVDALRSGQFQQGAGSLRTQYAQFCCLGVLCELASRKGIIEPPEPNPEDHNWHYDGAGAYLPDAVFEWAGLSGPNPRGTTQFLSHLNDQGEDFTFIANDIEERYLSA